MDTNGSGRSAEQTARALGWFSVGLGLAEILAPRQLCRLVGVREHRGLLRLLGLRELASGIAILSQPKPAGPVWSRVGGDFMDLGLLGLAMAGSRNHKGRVAAAAAAVAGITAMDYNCGQELSREPGLPKGVSRVCQTITINRSPQDIFSAWRNFELLPQFMNHLQSVRVMDEKRSHWVAKAPAGTTVEWDAEIVAEEPNKSIAWRSLPGADVHHSGSMRLEPAIGGRGTIVRVDFTYRPPVGQLGKIFAKVLGEEPSKQIRVDLHRFKQMLETGEIARTEGQPAGRLRSTSRRYDDFVRA